jgi:hypothetical protein
MKVYSQDEIAEIADHAFNHAILHIQNHLGQTDGGIAGIFFSGIMGELASDILKAYIRTEINFMPPPVEEK